MRYIYSLFQRLVQLKMKKKHGAKVLMFHQVTDDTNLWRDKSVCISKSTFVHLIENLEEYGYSFHALNELNENNMDNCVYITFDDIFSDAVENAIPFLIKKKIPFCCFIAPNLIDSELFITHNQLNELLNNPLCTIGFHTNNHKLMRYLDDEQVIQELDFSDFESQINRKINYFAFPYGSLYACSYANIKQAKNKDFKFIFSTICAPCSAEVIKLVPYFLPRINVNEENSKKIIDKVKKNENS